MKKHKEYAWGMSAAAFFFALALAGCDGVSTSAEAYTFYFRVQNNSEATITKVQFLDGSNRNSFVLPRYIGVNIFNGDLSDEYRVSGFTKEFGTSERFCGVLVTYEYETVAFSYGHFSHESKILVTSTDNRWTGKKTIALSYGSW
jgi:hypothetical protein